MSRIILSRHPNGKEHIVAGWDRSLNTAFVDEYDDEGECVRTRGPMNGERISPLMATAIARSYTTMLDANTGVCLATTLDPRFASDLCAEVVRTAWRERGEDL